MCYAAGTPGIPPGKLRCDCNQGELKRAGESHRGAARRAERDYAEVRGRKPQRVEASATATSPAPYPVSEPVTVTTLNAGWSGLSPLDAPAAPKKKPRKKPTKPAKDAAPEPAPEPKPAPEPAPEPTPEPAPEPATEPATEPETEPATEPAPEPAVEQQLENYLERSESRFTADNNGHVGTAAIAESRESLSRDDFAAAVTARMDDTSSPIYVDPAQPNAATAREAIIDVLYEKSPAGVLLYNAELAKQGKTPTYHLAETLNPAQRDAVAHAARVRAQEFGQELTSVSGIGRSPERVRVSTELGSCVSLASDLRFATALEESGEGHAAVAIKQLQDRTSLASMSAGEILSQGDPENSKKLMDVIGANPQSVPLGGRLSAVSAAQLRKDMASIGAIDEDEIDAEVKRTKRKFARSKRRFGSDEDFDNVIEVAVIASDIIAQDVTRRLSAPKNGRGAEAPLARATTDEVLSKQRDAASMRADILREEMDSVAPRYGGAYTDQIERSTKAKLSKKMNDTLDRAGSFLNRDDFVEAADSVRRKGVPLTVGKTTARAGFMVKRSRWTEEVVDAKITAPDDQPETALHETMHFMEFANEDYRAASITFLRGRAEGLQQTRIAGGNNGYGVADSFSDHYVGRVYDYDVLSDRVRPESSHLSSEVLTVGAEHHLSQAWQLKSMSAFLATNPGKVPATALYDDPEHAAFTAGMLTGGRRTAPTATI